MMKCALFPVCSIVFCAVLQKDLEAYVKHVNKFSMYFYVVA